LSKKTLNFSFFGVQPGLPRLNPGWLNSRKKVGFSRLNSGVGSVDVEGSSVLSGCRDEARRHVPDRQFIAETEMAMR